MSMDMNLYGGIYVMTHKWSVLVIF